MKTKSFRRILAAALPLLLFLLSCKKDPPVTPTADPVVEPPKYEQSIFLSVIDSGLTEVYLKLTITDTLMPRGFEIQRNNLPLITGSLCSKETTIVDQTAEMHSTYSYRAFRTNGSIHKDSTSVVSTQTLDTTSHEFVWTLYTFGGASSSVLFDALIINENDIWTVGGIFDYDSAGRVDVIPYNIVHWDGSKWEKKRYYYLFENTNAVFSPIRSIMQDSKGGRWFAAGSIFHIPVNSVNAVIAYSRLSLPSQNGTIRKIFIDDQDRVYGVGNEGTIVRGDSRGWTVFQTGTTQPFTDIFGSSNNQNNSCEILAVASSKSQYSGKELVQITEAGLNKLSFGDIQWGQISVWFVTGQRYYLAGSGVHSKKINDNAWQKESSFPSIYTNIIRGTGLNNIFVAGDFGLLSHFNGKTWKHFTNLANDAVWYGIAVTDSLVVVAGGSPTGKAFVLIGKK